MDVPNVPISSYGKMKKARDATAITAAAAQPQIAIDRDTVSRPMTRGLRTISIITAISSAAQDVDSGPARSDAKGVACTDVSSHQLRRHAAAHGLDEGRAGAVHRNDDVGLERL